MTRTFRRIVLLSLPVAAPLWGQTAGREPQRFQLVPDLTIGREEAGYALTHVSRVLPYGDRVYVVQPQESHVRVFDARGRYVATIGRRGRGPGEFQRPGHIGVTGDTLWVADPAQNRLTLFTPSGRLIKTYTFMANPVPRVYMPFHPQDLLAGGAILGGVSASGNMLSPEYATAMPLLTFRPDGSVRDTLGWISVRNSFIEIRDPSNPERGAYRSYQPFSGSPLVAAAPDGRFVAVVTRPPAASAGQAYFEVAKIAPDGRAVFSRKYFYQPTPIRPGVVEAEVEKHAQVIAQSRGTVRASSLAQAREWVRNALDVPRFFPPVAGAHAGGGRHPLAAAGLDERGGRRGELARSPGERRGARDRRSPVLRLGRLRRRFPGVDGAAGARRRSAAGALPGEPLCGAGIPRLTGTEPDEEQASRIGGRDPGTTPAMVIRLAGVVLLILLAWSCGDSRRPDAGAAQPAEERPLRGVRADSSTDTGSVYLP